LGYTVRRRISRSAIDPTPCATTVSAYSSKTPSSCGFTTRVGLTLPIVQATLKQAVWPCRVVSADVALQDPSSADVPGAQPRRCRRRAALSVRVAEVAPAESDRDRAW